MKIKFFYLIITCFFSVVLPAQNKIRWLTWEEAIKKQEKSPKIILVDVVIDQCGYCKKMDANTFSQDKIAKYVNENFYPIKFNAQTKSEISFKGQTYGFVSSFKGGYHELAYDILGGSLNYPTLVFFDENLELLDRISGYQDPLIFEMIIHYYAEEHYKTTPWRKFARNYPVEKNPLPVKKNNP